MTLFNSINWTLFYGGIYGLGASLVLLITRLYLPHKPNGREEGWKQFEKIGGIVGFSLLFASFFVIIYQSIFHPTINHPNGNLILIVPHVILSCFIPVELEVDVKFVRYHSIAPVSFIFFMGISFGLILLSFFWITLLTDRIVNITVFLSSSAQYILLQKSEHFRK